MTLKLSPTHQAVLEAVRTRGGWLSTHALGRLLPQYTGETVAKKARDLRRWGHLERRKVPDRETGGVFVEYHISAGPELSTSPAAMATGAPAGAGGVLFDVPQDKTVVGGRRP